MAAEARAWLQAMWMLLELLMAVFMERRTAKDSSNSSKPSSQTPKDETAAVQPGANSKGKSQHDARCGNTRTIESTELVPVTQCNACGADLSDTPCHGHERRTLIDQ